MTEHESASEDVKAKMREALERKRANDRGVPADGPVRQKAQGSEVAGAGGRRLRRRKSGDA
jgi:hypothetical protein